MTPELIRKQIALALLDTSSGAISEQRYWIDETEAKAFSKTGILNLTPIDPTRTVNVTVRWWNSFNSYLEIPDHPELIVIADKYLLPSSAISNLPECSNTPFTDILYVPYSGALQTPELIEAGKQYLSSIVRDAYSQLDQAQVKSHVYDNALVTADISPELIKSIAIIEHMDPQEFTFADDQGKSLSERVLTIIGANRELVFRYTGSPAGANGLAQFIEPTYKAMAQQYPEAKLTKNYMLGMANHVNAIKAMVLFFDSHKKRIGDGVNQSDPSLKELGITDEMLAAAYNGGPTKVIKSLNKYGLAWFSAQTELPQRKSLLRSETLQYIAKFSAIRDLHLF